MQWLSAPPDLPGRGWRVILDGEGELAAGLGEATGDGEAQQGADHLLPAMPHRERADKIPPGARHPVREKVEDGGRSWGQARSGIPDGSG